MKRAALLALVLVFLLPGGARAQSFAQLSGAAGCVLQTGLDFDDSDDESDVYVEDAPKDCGRAGGLMNARSVVVAPDQASVYVVSSGGALTGSNGVTTFSRGADGALTFRGCVTATAGDGRVGSDGLCTRADSLRGATSLALSPDGRSAYVA